MLNVITPTAFSRIAAYLGRCGGAASEVGESADTLGNLRIGYVVRDQITPFENDLIEAVSFIGADTIE